MTPTEWGVPERDPRMLWETLMTRRVSGRAFMGDHFAQARGIPRCLRRFRSSQGGSVRCERHRAADADPGIVRARAKIVTTIRGAQIVLEMQDKGEDFAKYCWAFVSGSPIAGEASTTQTELSATISKALKARGFKFDGPTIVYAWMQAIGLTNDHETGCFRKRQILDLEIH